MQNSSVCVCVHRHTARVLLVSPTQTGHWLITWVFIHHQFILLIDIQEHSELPPLTLTQLTQNKEQGSIFEKRNGPRTVPWGTPSTSFSTVSWVLGSWRHYDDQVTQISRAHTGGLLSYGTQFWFPSVLPSSFLPSLSFSIPFWYLSPNVLGPPGSSDSGYAQ